MRRKNFNGTTKYGVYGAALIAFVIIMLFTGLFIINSMAVEGILTHKSNEDAGKFSKTAQNGLLDLGDWDLLKDGNVRLDGYWEFYWNELISPGDFNRDSRLTGFYEIPRYWTSYSDQSFPAKGSATYRLKVHTNGSVGDLSIKVPEIYSEYALWVNGELVNSTGIFKKTKTTYLNPGIYTFCAKQPDLEIVLQINNEADIFGGVAQSIILGESGNVYSDINLNSAIDIFVIAFCLFFGIYHLMLFIFRRKDMQLMFFSAFCITVCIRSLMSSESLIMTLFPHLSFTLGSRVATISVPLCAIFLMHFTFETFREETPRVAFNLLAALNAIFAVTVIVTPTYIYTGIFLYYLFIAAATCCLGLYVTFKAAMKKKPEAYFFIAGLLLLVAGACIDTMVFLQMIKTGYMLSVGMCGFIICQAALLARKHSYAYTEVEKLSEDLKDSIDKVIKTETAYLNAQMKPHFLYNALNTIASFCETNSKEAGKLIIALSKYLRGTLDFDNMKSIVPLRKELEIVYAYVALEQARFEDIKVEFHIDESLLDFGIPPLTIQPLVENAIKYGLQQNGNKGVVKVTIEKTDNYVSVCVEDDGTGLPEEKMRRLLNAPIGSASIGLYNINTRLVRAYGKGLMINSSRGKGAILCFKIPIMEDVLDG